jgi:enoyl-CoA hydratase/carnithine racemase
MAPIELSVDKVSFRSPPAITQANHSLPQNIATITLNLPEKLNALTFDLYLLLGKLMRQVAEIPEVTITILTGTGRYFSASVFPSSPPTFH